MSNEESGNITNPNSPAAENESNLRSFYQYIPNFITESQEEYLLRKIAESPQPKWRNVSNRRLQIWGGELAGNVLLSQPLPRFLTTYPDIINRLANTGVFDESAHKAPNHVIINEYKPGDGIMPHEDGPAYHPVVATISLGSHAVFHYHRYLSSDSADNSNPDADATEEKTSKKVDPMTTSQGRAIDPKPVLSLLLEPRSVIITRGALYKEHLHSIEGVAEDLIAPSSASSGSRGGGSAVPIGDEVGYLIDNWELISDEKLKDIVTQGGRIPRETRVSLTCRDVEKVKKTPLVGLLGGSRGVGK